MKTLQIKTQKEFDAIKSDFSGRIEIVGWLDRVDRSFSNADIVVSGSATIEYVYGSATIKSVSGSATIKSVSDSATIEYVYGSATINLMALASIVLLREAKKITAKGFNLIRQIGKQEIEMDLGEDVTFVQINQTFEDNPSFSLFSKMFPIEIKGTKAILYKAVHKDGDIYRSDKDSSFTYKIGGKATENCDPLKGKSCSYGLHVSHKKWAIDFGKSWKDMALLECEVPIRKIVVSEDCDGKVRTSELKVIREVPKEEW